VKEKVSSTVQDWLVMMLFCFHDAVVRHHQILSHTRLHCRTAWLFTASQRIRTA